MVSMVCKVFYGFLQKHCRSEPRVCLWGYKCVLHKVRLTRINQVLYFIKIRKDVLEYESNDLLQVLLYELTSKDDLNAGFDWETFSVLEFLKKKSKPWNDLFFYKNWQNFYVTGLINKHNVDHGLSNCILSLKFLVLWWTKRPCLNKTQIFC